MPLYEYFCDVCKYCFEHLQKASDDKKAVCPKCQNPTTNIVISAGGFILKGDGWYKPSKP